MLRLGAFLIGSLWFVSTNAALYTVGAGGTHTVVQNAIDAALTAPGSDEIRIATGTFTENLDITPTGSGNILDISGGWDPSFTTRGEVPSIIDGGMTERVANISLDTGDGLIFENLKFQNGNAHPAAGLLIVQYGNSTMRISECEISNNIAEDDRAESGGLRVSANENSVFSLLDSQVSDNQAVCSGTVDCREGGMGLQAAGSADVTISRNLFSNNSVTMTEGSAFSGGANISAEESSVLLVEDNQFIGNSITGTANSGLGVGLALTGAGAKTARRNYAEANVANIPFPLNANQLSFAQFGDQTGILSDTVVVNGASKGIQTNTSGGGSPNIFLVNLTVVDNAGTGLVVNKGAAGGSVNVSNTISVDNGTNTQFAAGVTESNNLLTGPAGFVDAPGGNYALAEGSAAIGAGNNTPPGGLGPLDIELNARINDGTVDQGAYEFQSDVLIEDGFEDL